jgi:hypothetical protein
MVKRTRAHDLPVDFQRLGRLERLRLGLDNPVFVWPPHVFALRLAVFQAFGIGYGFILAMAICWPRGSALNSAHFCASRFISVSLSCFVMSIPVSF